MLVIGLIAVLAGITFILSTDSLHGYLYRTDRDMLIITLQHARSQAIGGICLPDGSISCSGGVPHGVHVNTDASGAVQGFVIFQGDAYDPDDAANAVLQANGTARLSLADVTDISQVVFAPFSASVASPGTIVLYDPMHVSTTTIGDEGQISWTN